MTLDDTMDGVRAQKGRPSEGQPWDVLISGLAGLSSALALPLDILTPSFLKCKKGSDGIYSVGGFYK